MEPDSTPTYFLDDAFSQRADQWAALLARILPKVNCLELNKFRLQGSLPDFMQEAEVALPQYVARTYGATHRFRLTPALCTYCQGLVYDDWQAGDFEDPAFYHNDQLVLGTISHEDYVVLRLSETEKALLNEQGYNFWCQWWLG